MTEISTNIEKLNVPLIHGFLTESYWAKGRTMDEVMKSIENSLNFGMYIGDNQIGFARICTDYTVFAYLMDVFILPEYQGKGYAKELMQAIISEPKLMACKVWMLKTADAHQFYDKFSFTGLKQPDKVMERILK